jgi:hypothetical protein
MRKVSLDELDCFFKRDIRGWSQDRVNVVRHKYECVEFEASFGALFFEDVEQEQGIGFDLEDASAIGGCGGDEVCA